jgi:chromosome segregation ATPase
MDSPSVSPSARPSDNSSISPSDSPLDTSRAISALEAALAALDERAKAEVTALRGQIASDEAQIAQLRAALDRAEQGRDAERARADALADRVHGVQVELAKAEAEGNALTIETAELTGQVKAAKTEAREAQDRAEELRQADAARRGRGRLARLRAAWRGE